HGAARRVGVPSPLAPRRRRQGRELLGERHALAAGRRSPPQLLRDHGDDLRGRREVVAPGGHLQRQGDGGGPDGLAGGGRHDGHERSERALMLLEAKTVIVTGVGTGLGRECVTSALREGANVVMAARTKETLDATCAELDPSGGRVLAVPTDITDADACLALVAAAKDRFGTVDALIQVAAFEYVFGGLRDTNYDDWRKAFETNVLGALTVLRPVADAMKESGGGAVAFVGSLA